MQNASSLGHPPDQSFIKPMAIVRAFGTASNQGSIYSPRKKKREHIFGPSRSGSTHFPLLNAFALLSIIDQLEATPVLQGLRSPFACFDLQQRRKERLAAKFILIYVAHIS